VMLGGVDSDRAEGDEGCGGTDHGRRR
jgi:hypothetical protein